MKPPKRGPANSTGWRKKGWFGKYEYVGVETHYKDDNQTVSHRVVTVYNEDGSVNRVEREEG